MDTAIKHPLPDRVKPLFVIFDIRALRVRVPGCQKCPVCQKCVLSGTGWFIASNG